jgi:hypothetical protein
MSIFPNYGNNYILIGILISKFIRYMIKNYINHSIHTQVEGLKPVNVICSYQNLKKIEDMISKIIDNQKQNPRYDYASNEQLEIDSLVYEAYGLNEEDIQEVQNWYARRYPKLARAQNNNRVTPKSEI